MYAPTAKRSHHERSPRAQRKSTASHRPCGTPGQGQLGRLPRMTRAARTAGAAPPLSPIAVEPPCRSRHDHHGSWPTAELGLVAVREPHTGKWVRSYDILKQSCTRFTSAQPYARHESQQRRAVHGVCGLATRVTVLPSVGQKFDDPMTQKAPMPWRSRNWQTSTLCCLTRTTHGDALNGTRADTPGHTATAQNQCCISMHTQHRGGAGIIT